MSREAFEEWISAPPYELSIAKYPDDPSKAAWPKCYRDISVQIAWDAWQAAQAEAVPEGHVVVPRLAVSEVLRISERQHPAWEEVRTALLSAAKGEQ